MIRIQVTQEVCQETKPSYALHEFTLGLQFEHTVPVIPSKENTTELEKAERMAVHRKRGMEWLPYQGRLHCLRFFSLQKKWLMADVVKCLFTNY